MTVQALSQAWNCYYITAEQGAIAPLIAKNIAYVMASTHDAARDAEALAGTRPAVEYQPFLRNYPAALFDAETAAQGGGAVAQAFRSQHQNTLALAWITLTTRPRFDAIIATGEDIGLPLALFSHILRIKMPIYIITHGSYIASPRFARLMRFLRGAENIHYLTLSQTLAESLVRDFGVNGNRVHNSGYGADTRFFDIAQPPNAATTDMPLIAAIGTASRDYRTLVEASRDLKATVCIGAGSAWYRMDVNITEKDLPANVTLHDSFTYLELRDLYALCAFAVVPLQNVRHACGYASIADVLAAGRPVIATKTPNYSDFIVNGETGFLVPPGDTDALRERMLFLLDNPEVSRQMGLNARRRMVNTFDMSLYAERIASAAGLTAQPVPMATNAA